MQRVHQLDISGFILEQGWSYCHLMVPMEFEAGREPYNTIGWVDPRTEEGDLAWPERFSPEAVARIEQEKGSFAYAGQYQQRPAPRGGGIIKSEHWRPYTPGRLREVWCPVAQVSCDVLYRAVAGHRTNRKSKTTRARASFSASVRISGRIEDSFSCGPGPNAWNSMS